MKLIKRGIDLGGREKSKQKAEPQGGMEGGKKRQKLSTAQGERILLRCPKNVDP